MLLVNFLLLFLNIYISEHLIIPKDIRIGINQNIVIHLRHALGFQNLLWTPL